MTALDEPRAVGGARFTGPVPSPTPPRPVADLSYEQARDELVSVVHRLEAGGETLEGSLELWERGEALAARCQEWLDGARERLETARTGGTGTNPARAARAASSPDEHTGDEHTDDEDPDDEDVR